MTTKTKRDFLSLDDLQPHEFDTVLQRAAQLKAARQRRELMRTLTGKVLGMVFEKASTRTRVSFEVGMFELGGHSVYLSPQGSQIGRGEPIEDVARVLGGYCDLLMMRTFAQERIATLAKWTRVPVINGLTDLYHPCQVLTDLFTVWELREDPWDLCFAWVGDGNNMANSWIKAAGILGLRLSLACPEGFDPDPGVVHIAKQRIRELGRGQIQIVRTPQEAVSGADVISTDVWASMGQEDQAAERERAFAGYCVDDDLVSLAQSEVIILHCLPAHRGQEITHSVLEGKHSQVWREAENRLHVQKAILEFCVSRLGLYGRARGTLDRCASERCV